MWERLDAQQWQEDLDTLVHRIRHEHRNPYHTVSPEGFERAVRSLRARIPMLASHEIVVHLARIVALVGDGHSILRLPEVPGFRRYPVNLYRFSDGLFIRSAVAGHVAHDLVGARLLAIDETPVEDAYALMRPLVSRDNEMGMIATAPDLLAIPEVVHAAGVARDLEHASFTMQCRNGEIATVSLPAGDATSGDRIDATPAPPPLWLRPAGEHWFEILPDEHALYVAHRSVRDGQDETLAAFFDRVFATIDANANAIDRLILDIRLNAGGNNTLNRSLVHHLIRCDRINRWGGLFAIVGRRTFSAAMNLVTDLERHTRVLFVGEPTGSSPNHYGETTVAALPHSRIPVSVSTLWWQCSWPLDDRAWVAPDLPAPLSSTDAFAGRDPALEAALTYQPGSIPLLDYPDRLFARLRRGDFR